MSGFLKKTILVSSMIISSLFLISPSFAQKTNSNIAAQNSDYNYFLSKQSLNKDLVVPQMNNALVVMPEIYDEVDVIIFIPSNEYTAKRYTKLFEQWTAHGSMIICLQSSQDINIQKVDLEYFVNRANEVSNIINKIPVLMNNVGKKQRKLFVAGHDIGAQTAMGILGVLQNNGGELYDLKDERVDAGIFIKPLFENYGMTDLNLNKPFMIITENEKWDNAFVNSASIDSFLVKNPKLTDINIVGDSVKISENINDLKVATTAFITLYRSDISKRYLNTENLYKDSKKRTLIYKK